MIAPTTISGLSHRGLRRACAAALAAFACLILLPASAGARQAALPVTTSLGGCQGSAESAVCQLNVSYGSIPGAQSYSATVIRADGSAIEIGGVPAGGTTLSVDYVGPGTYTVRITAFGSAPGGG